MPHLRFTSGFISFYFSLFSLLGRAASLLRVHLACSLPQGHCTCCYPIWTAVPPDNPQDSFTYLSGLFLSETFSDHFCRVLPELPTLPYFIVLCIILSPSDILCVLLTYCFLSSQLEFLSVLRKHLK